jgi:hypothetical protein
MKKSKLLAVCLIGVLMAFGLVLMGCPDGNGGGGGDDKKIWQLYMTTEPTKTVYRVGETLDTTGMVVTAYYDDNTNGPITDYTMKWGDTVLTHGTVITEAMRGSQTINVTAADVYITTPISFTITVKTAAPATAQVDIDVEVERYSYIGSGGINNITYYIRVYLTLPEGGEWKDDVYVDEETIKSWVEVNTGSMVPALNTWYFEVDVLHEDTLRLQYRTTSVTNNGTVTAKIVASKAGEMKGYTNITGTLTVSDETASDNKW